MFPESAKNVQSLKKVTRQQDVQGSGKTSEKLTFAAWNVNGFRNVMNKKNTVKDLVKGYSPDFICVSETKLSSEVQVKEKL